MSRPRVRDPVDRRALAHALRERVRGEVRFADGDRALYATDASNYRQVPIGVVLPLDTRDVIETVAVCRAFDAPVLTRGGGTSLAGQACNAAVVMDTSKYLNAVIDVDPAARLARVQPGVVLDDLRHALRGTGLTFAPDPATHTHCTIGGMIGNNSCGVHSVMAEFDGPGPRTSDNLEALEILTHGGQRLRVGATPDHELARILRAGGAQAEIYRRLLDLRDRYADLIRARYPAIPRRVSGYNLDELLPERGFHVARALAGSEGTCVVVLEATVQLMPIPPHRALIVLGYPSVYDAADCVPALRKLRPLALEGMDDRLVGYMRNKGLHRSDAALLPPGRGWLLLETGGETRAEALRCAEVLADAAVREAGGPSVRIFGDPAQAARIWDIRESGLGATAFVPGMPDTWEGWEDSAVAPERLGSYLRELRALFDRYGYQGALYGHFGQGCVHTRVNFDLVTAGGIQRFREFLGEATELVVRHGGSISGEHGDGQARAELLGRLFGPELVQAFREFKAIWDPAGRLNPGRVVDPLPVDAGLRLGPSYRPPEPETHFRFPNDRGSFARAALRCVGVGKCRRIGGGTMCPSYMVLREEKHTTRGRAHLLFEMLQGEALHDGWRSEAVKESLDLCLSCKGCKAECPVNVDIATYKAEFLSHYYEGRLRPRAAYAFGLIHWWARAAAVAPGIANLLTTTPGLRAFARAVAGVHPARRIPAFAPMTFRRWFRERQDDRRAAGLVPPGEPTLASAGRGPASAPLAHGGVGSRSGTSSHTRTGAAPGADVILWPDTFNDHFHPETAAAAVEVLEHAGWAVRLPETVLCCGRPLYEFGMLRLAKRQLRNILDALRPDIQAGTPIVGLEPSCVAVFRDELTELFPHDADARRLSGQVFTLAEFLGRRGYAPRAGQDTARGANGRRRALLHGHCHHKAIMKLDADRALLEAAGFQVDVPDTGCCGMAGPFGFERDKYDVAMAAGERVLLPAVRAAGPDTWIITDGFSCREQIAQATGRRALHLAEALQLAIHADAASGSPGADADGSARGLVEAASHRLAPPALVQPTSRARPAALLMLAAGALIGAALVSRKRRT